MGLQIFIHGYIHAFLWLNEKHFYEKSLSFNSAEKTSINRNLYSEGDSLPQKTTSLGDSLHNLNLFQTLAC